MAGLAYAAAAAAVESIKYVRHTTLRLQIASVAKALCHTAKFRVALAGPGTRTQQAERCVRVRVTWSSD